MNCTPETRSSAYSSQYTKENRPIHKSQTKKGSDRKLIKEELMKEYADVFSVDEDLKLRVESQNSRAGFASGHLRPPDRPRLFAATKRILTRGEGGEGNGSGGGKRS